jgi:hypothetical protein
MVLEMRRKGVELCVLDGAFYADEPSFAAWEPPLAYAGKDHAPCRLYQATSWHMLNPREVGFAARL